MVKSEVFFSLAVPVVLPWEVFQDTLSPLLIAMARTYLPRPSRSISIDVAGRSAPR